MASSVAQPAAGGPVTLRSVAPLLRSTSRAVTVGVWAVLEVRHIAELKMNWFRSAGYTVTVTRIGFMSWSKPVRKISKTVASCVSPKNSCSVLVRVACGDPVSLADLPDSEGLGQVTHGPILDVLGHQQPGRALGDELHRVEGRLKGPRDVVNEAHLVSADHLCVRFEAQPMATSSAGAADPDVGTLCVASRAVRSPRRGTWRARSAPLVDSGLESGERQVTKGSIFLVTKVPWPCLVSTRPWLISRLIASRIVFRDALYASLSSSSVGSRVPGLRTAGSWLPGATATGA